MNTRLYQGLLLLAALAIPAGARADTLLLEVLVNGRSRVAAQEVDEQQGRLMVAADQLADLGIRAQGRSDPVDLASLPGGHYRLDQAAARLYLDLPDRDLIAQQLRHDPRGSTTANLPSDRAAVLNYDTQYTRANGQDTSSTLARLRLLGGPGILETSSLQTRSTTVDNTVRLDTTWTQSDLDHLRSWKVGDFVNGGLGWTRPVRLAGVQMATNFGLRPDLVTYPRPGISSSVAVPSSVDIYVNGLHQLSGQVEPGPFEASQLPVATGSGDIAVVVKDASGRQTTQMLPFYTSSLLLSPGLDSLSLEAGSVRQHYASQSADYAQGAASVTWRHGASDRFTWESHLEGSDTLAMGGAGGDWLLGQVGVFNLSLAASQYQGQTGKQFGLGFSHASHLFNAGFSVLRADHAFNDLASANGDDRPGTSLSANLGWSLPGLGSLGMVFTKKRVNIYDEYADTSNSVLTTALALTYSRPLPWGAYGSISAVHDYTGTTGNGLFIGLSVPFGDGASLSASSSHSGGSAYQTVQAERPAVERGDLGWRVARETGDIERDDFATSYKSPYGLVSGEAERSSTGTDWRASAQGAVTLLGGHLFASNTIDDAFALVDTDGLADVTVRQENRDLGRTDSHGLLFVEQLRAFEDNHLSIDPGDVPMDVDLDTDQLHVTPGDRSAVRAHFAVHRAHSATLHLLDSTHHVLPVGAIATLAGSGEQTPLGYDGEAFFQQLADHNHVRVHTPGHPDCSVTFDYHAEPGQIPDIGPLICQ
ncbi:fimbria/pilus outer membrane usher protein [Pseudomonas sp. TE3610]